MTDHAAIQDLIHRYWNALDRRDYPAMLDLLTEEVDWKVSAACRGRAEVAAVLEARPAALVVRHLVSNLVVESGTEDEWEVFFLLTAFGRLAEADETPPYPSAPPQILGDMRAAVTRTGGTLRISRIAAAPIFRAAH